MCDYFPKGSSVKSTVVQTLGAKSIAKKKKKKNKIQEPKKNPVELGDGIKSWTRNTLEKRNRGEVPKQNKTKQNKVLKWSKCDAEHQKYDPGKSEAAFSGRERLPETPHSRHAIG